MVYNNIVILSCTGIIWYIRLFVLTGLTKAYVRRLVLRNRCERDNLNNKLNIHKQDEQNYIITTHMSNSI